MPRSASEDGASRWLRIRSVTFSPCVVGRTATRTSTVCSPRRIETLPSCGTRRSAMSRSPMIFSRLVTAGASGAADRGDLADDAVDACADISRRCCGVKWMSDAPRSSARAIVLLTKTTAGVMASKSRTVDPASSWRSATSSIRATSSCAREIAASIESDDATPTRIGILRASRSSSEKSTFVGSATATSKVPSSLKRTGSAR